MSEPKEKSDAEKHEDFEKQQERDGIAVHGLRGPINPATGRVDAPVDGKKKPKE